jgi:hypothetical protein
MCSLWIRVPVRFVFVRHRPGSGGVRADPPTGRFGFAQPAQPASAPTDGGSVKRTTKTDSAANETCFKA